MVNPVEAGKKIPKISVHEKSLSTTAVDISGLMSVLVAMPATIDMSEIRNAEITTILAFDVEV